MCSKGFDQAFPVAAFHKSPLFCHGTFSHPTVCAFSGTSWKQLCTLRVAVYGCCMACRHKGDACGIVWCLWCIDVWQTKFSWCIYFSLAQGVSRQAQMAMLQVVTTLSGLLITSEADIETSCRLRLGERPDVRPESEVWWKGWEGDASSSKGEGAYHGRIWRQFVLIM